MNHRGRNAPCVRLGQISRPRAARPSGERITGAELEADGSRSAAARLPKFTWGSPGISCAPRNRRAGCGTVPENPRLTRPIGPLAARWGRKLMTDGTSSAAPARLTAEHARLAEATGAAEDDLFTANPWYEWGPYLAERAWGTVREDYSATGDAWSYFPHDHARSRAYRWNEDGMAGLSDIHHDLCLGSGAVERGGPDPEGADVRTDRPAGQPRRGRQGLLVVPGCAAQSCLAAVALPLPAERVSRINS